MAYLKDEQANEVFDILVEFGANENYRKVFAKVFDHNPTELERMVRGVGFWLSYDFGFAASFGSCARLNVNNDGVYLILMHEATASEQTKNERRERQKILNDRLKHIQPSM